jgi:hypothetical protein
MGDDHPGVGRAAGLLSTAFSTTFRWVVVPCVGVAVFALSAATLAGLHSAASLAYANSSFVPNAFSLQPHRQAPQQALTANPTATAHKLLVAPAEKAVRVASLSATRARPKAAEALRPPADPFAKIVAEAKLSRAKLVAAFAKGGMAMEPTSAAETADPFASIIADANVSRGKLLAAFARAGMAIEEASAEEAATSHGAADAQPEIDPLSTIALGRTGLPVELAYAAVETDAGDPVELALASLGDDALGMDADVDGGANDLEMPDRAELPSAKPETGRAKPDAKPAKPADKPAKADDAKPGRKPQETAEKPAAPARKPGSSDRQESQQELAYARPDKPGIGAFKNLFNTPKAGKGVAIYDISAAVVHMPDGSKLEAHSGIGKMADNPRYVHVKMNGPTPPNTYKLSMREKRFHGVEAVRMTPIGDQTMHGRDGILAHSYLLRGGREESHGCVAFANYPKFLKAFKQGKVTHIVVVPSMSKMPKVRLASNGRGA